MEYSLRSLTDSSASLVGIYRFSLRAFLHRLCASSRLGSRRSLNPTTQNLTNTSSPAPKSVKWPSLGNRPALDGLRGLAILAVMAFHLQGGNLAPNGQVGVDIFFVLSGFLITTLLLQEWGRSSTLNLSAFYLRRALRLFPALAALLAAGSLIVLLSEFRHIPGTDAAKIRHLQNGIAYSLIYATNWARAFGVDAGLLGHTWSLAIEEQFYLFWPPILLVALRFTNLRRLALGLGLALVMLGVWRSVLWQEASVSRFYFGTDSRVDMILTGCALSCLFTLGLLPRSGWRLRLLRAGALASIAFLLFLVESHINFASNTYDALYGVVEVSAAVVIASIVSEPEGLLASVLSHNWLVWLGRLSYSLYLWHYPVFQGIGAESYVGWVLEILLAVALAACSFYFIETRFLAIRERFRLVGVNPAPRDQRASLVEETSPIQIGRT